MTPENDDGAIEVQASRLHDVEDPTRIQFRVRFDLEALRRRAEAATRLAVAEALSKRDR